VVQVILQEEHEVLRIYLDELEKVNFDDLNEDDLNLIWRIYSDEEVLEGLKLEESQKLKKNQKIWILKKLMNFQYLILY